MNEREPAYEAQFLLARRGGVSDSGFLDALKKFVGEAPRTATCLELVTLVPADSLSALPHIKESGRTQAADAILTVAGDERSVSAVAEKSAGWFKDVADAQHSEVCGGRRHSILPGSAPVRLFFGLRRLARLSRAEFLDYWLNVHADFGRRLIPPYTYHQIHAEERLTDALSRLSGMPASTFDGIVEVHFPDLDALIRQLMRPDVATDALADERNFIDHTRSAFHVYRDPG